MIFLHQFPPGGGLPNLSPFCLKLETWLRLAHLEYQCVYTANPRSAPRGKLPFIEFNGQRIADSSECVEFLADAFHVELDAGLSPQQKALAQCLQALFEDRGYWAVLYLRWADPLYWPHTRQAFFGGLPEPLRSLVPLVARRSIVASLRAQGTGRLPQELIYHRVEDLLAAVSTLLGEQPYLLGEAPTSIDATGYGFLAQLYLADLPHPFAEALVRFPNLRDYVLRLRERCFPDR